MMILFTRDKDVLSEVESSQQQGYHIKIYKVIEMEVKLSTLNIV